MKLLVDTFLSIMFIHLFYTHFSSGEGCGGSSPSLGELEI